MRIHKWLSTIFIILFGIVSSLSADNVLSSNSSSGSYVQATTSQSISNFNGHLSHHWSIAAWIKPQAGHGTINIAYKDFSAGSSWPGNTQLMFRLQIDNKLTLGIDDFSAGGWNWFNTSSGVITEDVWNHVAVVKAGNSIKMYVNGVQIYSGTQTTTPTKSASTKWQFGSSLLGEMDDIAIYNTSLSSSDVGGIYTNGVNSAHANLVGYWDFETNSGSSNAIDQSGEGLTLALFGAMTRSSGSPYAPPEPVDPVGEGAPAEIGDVSL